MFGLDRYSRLPLPHHTSHELYLIRSKNPTCDLFTKWMLEDLQEFWLEPTVVIPLIYSVKNVTKGFNVAFRKGAIEGDCAIPIKLFDFCFRYHFVLTIS